MSTPSVPEADGVCENCGDWTALAALVDGCIECGYGAICGGCMPDRIRASDAASPGYRCWYCAQAEADYCADLERDALRDEKV